MPSLSPRLPLTNLVWPHSQETGSGPVLHQVTLSVADSYTVSNSRNGREPHSRWNLWNKGLADQTMTHLFIQRRPCPTETSHLLHHHVRFPHDSGLSNSRQQKKWPQGPRVPTHSSACTAQCGPYLVKPKDILNEKAVCVVPREQHILEDIPHTFLLKVEVLCSYYRGIDQL